MNTGTRHISKSTFLSGLQCSKLLWSIYNARHLFPKVDEATQSIFDQANAVGAFAKRMFPTGIETDTSPGDFDGAIKLTQAALLLRRPIFEATFAANGGYARADILNPVGQDAWDIIEAKSTTKTKDVHIPDLAFQAWVFTAAGIKIRRCVLCHVNNQFVRHGDVHPQEFFSLRDVTAKVMGILSSISEQVRTMERVIGLAECPKVSIGKQCDSPMTCPLRENCWPFLPSRNVLELYCDTKGRGFDLLSRGVLRLAEIPAEYPLTEKQAIQRAVAISGHPHVKRIQIERFSPAQRQVQAGAPKSKFLSVFGDGGDDATAAGTCRLKACGGYLCILCLLRFLLLNYSPFTPSKRRKRSILSCSGPNPAQLAAWQHNISLGESCHYE